MGKQEFKQLLKITQRRENKEWSQKLASKKKKAILLAKKTAVDASKVSALVIKQPQEHSVKTNPTVLNRLHSQSLSQVQVLPSSTSIRAIKTPVSSSSYTTYSPSQTETQPSSSEEIARVVSNQPQSHQSSRKRPYVSKSRKKTKKLQKLST
jgi:hypothetical protein